MNVLFDLDGTLTDPQEGILGSLVHALREVGAWPITGCEPVHPYAELRWVIGPPLQGSISKLLGDDAERCARCLEAYRQRFSATGLFENEVYPGIPEMLVAMQASGHRLFVATSKPTVYSTQIIDHFQLSGYFERVYGSELDGRLTDKGELIGHILTSERLDARDTVMVGDRMHDMVGARANSVIGIGVLYGYGDRDELDSAGAVALVESPADLPSAIKALHRG